MTASIPISRARLGVSSTPIAVRLAHSASTKIELCSRMGPHAGRTLCVKQGHLARALKWRLQGVIKIDSNLSVNITPSFLIPLPPFKVLIADGSEGAPRAARCAGECIDWRARGAYERRVGCARPRRGRSAAHRPCRPRLSMFVLLMSGHTP